MPFGETHLPLVCALQGCWHVPSYNPEFSSANLNWLVRWLSAHVDAAFPLLLQTHFQQQSPAACWLWQLGAQTWTLLPSDPMPTRCLTYFQTLQCCFKVVSSLGFNYICEHMCMAPQKAALALVSLCGQKRLGCVCVGGWEGEQEEWDHEKFESPRD